MKMPGYMLTGLLFMVLGATSCLAHDDDISVGLDANESPPYWSATMLNNGMGGEIVHAISEEAGLVSHIHFKPLQRMIEDDSNNDLGNPDFYVRNQVFADIIPIAIYQSAIFYYAPNHKENISIRRMEDLKRYRIGILKGTLVDRTAFEKAGVVFETSYSQDSLFKKMKLGRIDLCLEVDLVGHQIINRLFPDQRDDFATIALPKSTEPLAILLSADYPQARAIGERYREGLHRIIRNGKYEKILEHYYGEGKVPSDWQEQLKKFERLYNFSVRGR